jgi:hypothetical protein
VHPIDGLSTFLQVQWRPWPPPLQPLRKPTPEGFPAPALTSALPTIVRCRILVGGVQRDAAATLVGNAAPSPTGEMGPSVAEIVLQTAITTTASKAFKLDCQHDFSSAGMYVDPGASIMIVKATGPLG